MKGEQLVELLRALTAANNGKRLKIWDGLPALRSRVEREYKESLNGRIALERLPGYAPELNPVEYLFGYARQRELANLYQDTIAEVSATHMVAQISETWYKLISVLWK